MTRSLSLRRAHHSGRLRNTHFRALVATLVLSAQLAIAGFATAGTELRVYKQTSCACCEDWVAHMRNSGFRVSVLDVDDVRPYRHNLGVTDKYRSCHTAFVERTHQVVEGHVPAAEIARLIAERSDGVILAVPGMPHGSPGMPARDGHTDPYEVLHVDRAGSTTVYASYPESAVPDDHSAPARALTATHETGGTGERVTKAVLNGLLALLLGAGVMGVARMHCRRMDKGKERGKPVKMRRGQPTKLLSLCPRGMLLIWLQQRRRKKAKSINRHP